MGGGSVKAHIINVFNMEWRIQMGLMPRAMVSSLFSFLLFFLLSIIVSDKECLKDIIPPILLV